MSEYVMSTGPSVHIASKASNETFCGRKVIRYLEPQDAKKPTCKVCEGIVYRIVNA